MNDIDDGLENWRKEMQKAQRKAKRLIPRIIGTTLEEAREMAHKHDANCRVRNIDGVGMLGTADMRPERLNFTVENNIVTKITLG